MTAIAARQFRLKAVARLEERSSALQGAIKTLRAMFTKVGLAIDYLSTTPDSATVSLEGDVSVNTWRHCMDKLGFTYVGDHYELPNFKGVGLFYDGSGTVSVRMM